MNLRSRYFRHLLCDTKSLSRYFKECSRVTLQDVRRDLMLIERKGNTAMPDHFYRLGQEKAFEGMERMADLFLMGLASVAEELLEYRGDRLYVKADKTNEWQLTIPLVPPLLLIAIKIWQGGKTDVCSVSAARYIHKEITPCVSHTALLCPYIAELEELKNEKGGFADLHIHLNGALETDCVWQDFLAYPEPIYREIARALASNEKVKEQYAQFTNLTTADDFLQMLYTANQLRWKIFDLCFGVDDTSIGETKEDNLPHPTFLQYLSQLRQTKDELHKHHHPIQSILPKTETDLRMECYLYVKVFDTLHNQRDNDALAGLFHYYLLILGLANKMLVQQPFVTGFEEFQKYTSNGFREFSEYTYLRRFLQMNGSRLDNVRLIEGRFSPKDTVWKNRMKIVAGVKRGLRRLHDICMEECGKDVQTELSLVAHFIKKPENKQSNELYTFEKLREELDLKADVLIEMRHDEAEETQSIVGIDAAASEFDTPPEVFAPAYRRLRETGYRYFTYHAGEDFFHVLSGLRAVYEAIVFLDLRSGDRIGHATATGVGVALWRKSVGEELLVRQGEYLDDLLFAYHIISEKGEEDLKVLLPTLSDRIAELSWEVYGIYHSLPVMLHAWLLRHTDPRLLLKKDNQKWSEAETLLMSYQTKAVQQRYRKIITVKSYDVLDEAALTKLQLLMLKEMHRRNIIIETLPTSNVLIGYHHDFSTHQLVNWYRWEKEGHEIPPIVVGTDDAGVFATNIYNEYCNIFCMLKAHGYSAPEITDFIRKLDYNARLYAFKNN